MQYSRLLFRFIHTVLLIVFFASCDDENPLDVDVSGITISQDWKSLNHDLESYDFTNHTQYQDSLLNTYGSFYKLYVQRVLRLGHVQDPALPISMEEYLNDPYVKEMYLAIDTSVTNLDQAERELKLAMRYYRYHFPDAFIPPVVTCATNFSYNVIAADSMLGIGLELYLGEDHPLYQEAGFQLYRRQKSNPEFMPFDAARGWFLSEFQGHMEGDNLLPIILEYGKVMYLMDACFPKSKDYLKISYTEDQLKWCADNEWQIWSYLLEQNALYSSEGEIIRKYTGEGPFTAGLPRESPSQVGYWIGWEIIRSFMENNPETTLSELMSLTNPQQVLQQSAYKPETK